MIYNVVLTQNTTVLHRVDIIECKKEDVIGWGSFPSCKLTVTVKGTQCPYNEYDPIYLGSTPYFGTNTIAQRGVYYLDNHVTNGDGTYTMTMYDVSYKLNKFQTHGDFFCGQTFEESIHNLLTWCGYDWTSTDGLADCRNIYQSSIDFRNTYKESKLYGHLDGMTIKQAILNLSLSLGLRVMVDNTGRIKFTPLAYRTSASYSIEPENMVDYPKFITTDKVDFVEVTQDYDWSFDSTNHTMHKYHTRTMPDFTADTNYEAHKYFDNYYWLPWMMYSYNGTLTNKMNYSIWTGADIPARFSVDPSVTDNPSLKQSNMTAYYMRCLIDTPASSQLQPEIRNSVGLYKGCNNTSMITYPYTGEVAQRWKNYNLKTYNQCIGVFKDTLREADDGCDFYDPETLATELYKWLNPKSVVKVNVWYPNECEDVYPVNSWIVYKCEGDTSYRKGIITERVTDYTKSSDLAELTVRELNDNL